MIQRIQTIFLLLAVVLSVVCLCMQIGTFMVSGMVIYSEYNLWITDPIGNHSFVVLPLFLVLLLSAAIGLFSIFKYSNRLLQARLCLCSIVLLVVWYILYAIFGKVILPDYPAAEFKPAFAGVYPLLAIFFYLLARRAILADERLVRAADRIR